jgi:hypothetical protein
MAPSDLHAWSLTVLVAALLAVSLSLQGLPAQRAIPSDSAVCEKPGLQTMALVLALH